MLPVPRACPHACSHSSRGHGSNPTAQHRAPRSRQRLPGEEGQQKSPLRKQCWGFPLPAFYAEQKEVFCVSQPNFPRCLASSQARLLPPAFVFLPGARREGITAGREGTHCTGAGPSSTSPPLHPAGHPSGTSGAQHPGPGQAARGRMPTAQACTAPTGAQRQDQGKGLLFFPSDSAACPRAQAVRPQRPCQGEESRRAETAGLFCPTPLQSDFSCGKLLLPGGSGSSCGAEMELSSSPSEQGLLEDIAIRLRAPAGSDSWGCCAAHRALEEHPHCNHFTLGPRTCRLTSCVPPYPSRQTSHEQDPRWKPGAVAEARFLRVLHPKYHQITSLMQFRHSCSRPEIQITASCSSSIWISAKAETKSPCLRQGWFIRSTPKGLHAGGGLARTCCHLWDSLQCCSPPDGLTKRLSAAETALPGPGQPEHLKKNYPK